MKALLIGINSKYIHPSLALYQLKKNTKYDCQILELTIKDSISRITEWVLEILKTNEFDIIGCSCYLWNIEYYLQLIKEIKRFNKNIYILMGGPEVSYDAQYFLSNNSSIDFIISSEGEESFDMLLNALDHNNDLNNVPNLYYRKDNNIIYTYHKYPDLNKVLLATLDVAHYKKRIVYLESSRGCPYTCSYCTASLEARVRYFPLEYILDILYQLMINETKIVKFLDRTFNANKEYMIKILDFIDQHNICTTFQFEVVVETISQDIIDKINSLKGKYLRFEVGIQSTNNEVNLAVSRRQNMVKLKENIFLLKQTHKVDLHIDLIAGLPYETKESFISSFNEAFLLRGEELQLGFLKFLRGTKMMDMIDEHEYVYDNHPPYEIIKNKYLNQDDLEEIHQVEKSLNRYYNNNICPHLFNYLLDNQMVSSYYDFFKGLYKDISHYQKDELFVILDNYLKDLFKDDYEYLHYLLKIDYLENFKVRPKIWWKNPPLKKDVIFKYICSQNNDLSLELLYRYSIVITYNNLIYVIIYKDFKFSSFHFKY